MAKMVRIVIDAKDQCSEILAVRETPDGSLVMLFKRSDQLGGNLADMYENTDENRASVHVTPDKPYNTITHHIRLANGEYQKSYTRISKKGRLVWPIIMTSTPDISQPRYKAKIQAKDVVLSMGSYDPAFSVLVFTVVVTSARFSIRPPYDMNGMKYDFLNFTVHIFWCYMASISIHQGQLCLFAGVITSYVNKNLVSEFRHSELNNSFNRGQLISVIEDRLKVFSHNHIDRLDRYFASGNKRTPNGAASLARNYLKEPFLP